MKKAFLALVALGIGLSLTACNTSPTPEEKVQQLVQQLKNDGHQVDEVPDPKDKKKLVANAGWETETKKEKQRRNGQSVTVTRSTKIAEIIVVIPGSNCKIEVEALLDGNPRDYYVDEGRDKNGNEMALPSGFPLDRPSPRELEDYLKKGQDKKVFAFCAGLPYKHSD